MPELDPMVISLIAAISGIFVQTVKGLLNNNASRWIPLVVIVVMSGVGCALSAYAGRDLVAGLLEGLFGGATSVGVYEGLSSLPGVNRVVNSDGWITKDNS